ncbi:hypothetical protein ACWDOR_12540 [Streptosporangium canum]
MGGALRAEARCRTLAVSGIPPLMARLLEIAGLVAPCTPPGRVS